MSARRCTPRIHGQSTNGSHDKLYPRTQYETHELVPDRDAHASFPRAAAGSRRSASNPPGAVPNTGYSVILSQNADPVMTDSQDSALNQTNLVHAHAYSRKLPPTPGGSLGSRGWHRVCREGEYRGVGMSTSTKWMESNFGRGGVRVDIHAHDLDRIPADSYHKCVHAPVAKWIRHRPPEPESQVRILSGVPSSSKAAGRDRRLLLFAPACLVDVQRARAGKCCVPKSDHDARAGGVLPAHPRVESPSRTCYNAARG